MNFGYIKIGKNRNIDHYNVDFWLRIFDMESGLSIRKQNDRLHKGLQ